MDVAGNAYQEEMEVAGNAEPWSEGNDNQEEEEDGLIQEIQRFDTAPGYDENHDDDNDRFQSTNAYAMCRTSAPTTASSIPNNGDLIGQLINKNNDFRRQLINAVSLSSSFRLPALADDDVDKQRSGCSTRDPATRAECLYRHKPARSPANQA
jgi:hypothetical protein